jgi:hypothetical protein
MALALDHGGLLASIADDAASRWARRVRDGKAANRIDDRDT